MNPKLVESLVDAVVALPQDDYALFQEVIINHMIRKTPGVAGGYACLRNTRVAVWTLVSLVQQGMDEDELLENFPGLTPFDLFAVQAYYRSHKTEIDSVIAWHHDDESSEDADEDDALSQRLNQQSRPLDLEGLAFVGMWKDRPELEDSTAWVRQLREQQWR